jgi:hypothetical protein
MTVAKASARFQELLNSLKSRVNLNQSSPTKGRLYDRYVLNRRANSPAPQQGTNTPTNPSPNPRPTPNNITPTDGGIRPVSRPIPGPQERVPDSDIRRQQLEDEYQLRFKKQQEEYRLRN